MENEQVVTSNSAALHGGVKKEVNRDTEMHFLHLNI